MNIMCLHPALSMGGFKQMYALNEKGYKIYLVYYNIGISMEYEDHWSVWEKTFEIPKSNIKGAHIPRLLVPGLYKKMLQNIVRNYKIDLIHVFSNPDILAIAARRYTDVPVIFNTRDMTTAFNKNQIAGNYIHPFLMRNQIVKNICIKACFNLVQNIERKANELSDGRIFVSKTMKKYAMDNYQITDDNTIVFPNYTLEKDIPKENLPKLSDSDGEIHLVYEGGVGLKGYRNILTHFQEIAKRNIHLHLYLVGDKQEISIYQKLLRNNKYIHFHKPKPLKLLLKDMTQYDFGLVPFINNMDSRHLNTILPNKLFDYLSCGLPVASALSESMKDYFNENNVGFVYKNNKDLKSKLNTYENSFRINRIKYSMEQHIEEIIELYNAVCS